MRNNLTRRLCTGGVIAALYAVLTITRDEPHEREIKVTVS